jgi:hypothetical protein
MKSLILFSVALILASSAPAATVNFSGEVSKCSMYRLVSEVRALAQRGDTNITVLIRDSDGGDLYAAINANEELRRYNVNTNLQGTCASSCTVLFAAGQMRSASNGEFMFHAVGVGTRKISTQTATAISTDPCQPSAVNIILGERLTKAEQLGFRNKFAADWLEKIRQASPSLADKLYREHTLTESTREDWIEIRAARRFGFINN